MAHAVRRRFILVVYYYRCSNLAGMGRDSLKLGPLEMEIVGILEDA